MHCYTRTYTNSRNIFELFLSEINRTGIRCCYVIISSQRTQSSYTRARARVRYTRVKRSHNRFLPLLCLLGSFVPLQRSLWKRRVYTARWSKSDVCLVFARKTRHIISAHRSRVKRAQITPLEHTFTRKPALDKMYENQNVKTVDPSVSYSLSVISYLSVTDWVFPPDESVQHSICSVATVILHHNNVETIVFS